MRTIEQRVAFLECMLYDAVDIIKQLARSTGNPNDIYYKQTAISKSAALLDKLELTLSQEVTFDDED